MKTLMRLSSLHGHGLIAFMLLSSSALPAAGAEWIARHGLTSAQYQQHFTENGQNGFRLVSVSGHESDGQARYAAVWVKKSGPALVARHGLNSQQYQAAFDQYVNEGYRLTFVNGYAVGGQAHYAAIWQKTSTPRPWAARHGLTLEQFQQASRGMRDQGFALSHVSAYTVGGTPRFAAIFEKGNPDSVAWRPAFTSAQYQEAFNTLGGQGYRLKVVSGYRDGNSDRYAAIWTKAGGPQWLARHGVPAANYQQVFDNNRNQGWAPIYVEAYNSASGVRYNGIWEK